MWETDKWGGGHLGSGWLSLLKTILIDKLFTMPRNWLSLGGLGTSCVAKLQKEENEKYTGQTARLQASSAFVVSVGCEAVRKSWMDGWCLSIATRKLNPAFIGRWRRFVVLRIRQVQGWLPPSAIFCLNMNKSYPLWVSINGNNSVLIRCWED